MEIPGNLKALALGVGAYALGYGALLVLGSLVPHEPHTPLWFVSAVLALLVPVGSGLVAGRIASTAQLRHGVIVGVLGTLIALGVVTFGAGVHVAMGTALAWLVAAAMLGAVGAFFSRSNRVGL